MPSKLIKHEDRALILTARGVVYTIDLEDVPKVEGRSWSTLSSSRRYAVADRKPKGSGKD